MTSDAPTHAGGTEWKAYVAWPRSYDVNGVRIEGSPMPSHIESLFNSKFLDQESPASDRIRFCYFDAPTRQILVNNSPVTVSGWALYFGDVGILDVVLSVEVSDYHVLVDQRTAELGRAGAAGITDMDGNPLSVHDLCDEAFAAIVGDGPGQSRRSRFGTVAAVESDWDSPVGLSVAGGLSIGHEIFYAHDKLIVRAASPLAADDFREYVFLATFSCRARLLHSNLNRDIRSLVRAAGDALVSSRAALRVFQDSVQLERRAIVARQYFTPLDFLGAAEHVDVIDRIGETLVMTDREWAVLEDSLAGLERYTQGLFVLTSARGQNAFNRNGLLFAGFGLLFAAVGILAMFQKNQPVLVVFAAWALCVGAFVAVNPAWWRAAWTQARRRRR